MTRGPRGLNGAFISTDENATDEDR